jgi:hypothetical protein
MPQSNVIFFYLFAAFFVFITLRGELPKYMGFVLASPTGGGTAPSSQVSRGPDLAKIAQVASIFG